MNENFIKKLRKVLGDLRLTTQAVEYVERVIQSPPSRNVSNRGGKNVLLDVASKKMGHTIAVESYSVEGAYLFCLEFDPTVVGYFAQPEPIPLKLTDLRGFKRIILKTFDFLVVYEDRIEIVECKPTDWLLKTAEVKPLLCTRNEDGRWQSPEMEPQIEDFGFIFHYADSANTPKKLVRNLVFLEPVRDHSYSEERAVKNIINRLDSSGSESVEQLITQINGYTKNDVFSAILKGDVYFDLIEDLLSEPSITRVYRTRECRELHRFFFSVQPKYSEAAILLKTGERIVWNEQSYLIANVSSKGANLLGSDGALVPLNAEAIALLVKSDQIQTSGHKNISTPELSPELRNVLTTISDEQFRVASDRANYVRHRLKSPREDSRIFPIGPVSTRQAQRWSRRYLEAECKYGNGLFGLFPKKRAGNRRSKLPASTVSIMKDVVFGTYMQVHRPTLEHCYRMLRHKCQTASVHSPSRKSFLRYVRKSSTNTETVLAREGSRRAYETDYDAPGRESWLVAADFPEKYAQVDATPLDEQMVSSDSRVPIGKPWLILLHSPVLRAPWAFIISFNPPNSRDVMLLFRECYHRWRQIPQFIGADNGREFNNTGYDRLLAAFELHKVNRPPAKARFGSSIESYNRRIHNECIYNLKGNTQNSKNIRQVTKATDAVENAVWTLPTLHEHLEKYFFDVCWNTLADEINNTPMRELERRRALVPSREQKFHLSERDIQILFSSEKPHGGAKVQPGRGIWLSGYYYWHETFALPTVEGSTVAVRYDPYDLRKVFAFVQGDWVDCLGRNIPELLNFTEKQRRLVAYEKRYLKQTYQSRRDADRGARLAVHAVLAENSERLLIQQKKDAEADAIRRKDKNATRLKQPTIKELEKLDFRYLRAAKS